MIATGVFGSNINRSPGNVAQTLGPPTSQGQNPRSNIASLGLSFDPYDYSPLHTRILVTGAAANFPSVANLAGDVFNAPVFMPSIQVDSAQVMHHKEAPISPGGERSVVLLSENLVLDETSVGLRRRLGGCMENTGSQAVVRHLEPM